MIIGTMPMNRKIALVGAMLLALPFATLANQEAVEPNSPVNLTDYLRIAALNNAGLKASFEQWKAALEQVPQAKALPDPRFTYGYFIEEVETRVGPQEHKFGIMQVFPWFGKIEARTDAAAAAAKAARQRYEAEKLKLFYQVKDAFYEYVYLAKATEIARQNLELLKHFEAVARTKYATSGAGHPDVIRAQVEMAKLEDILRSLQELREPIVAKLNAILNRDIKAPLPWPSRPDFSSPVLSRRGLMALTVKTNPELAALDYDIEAARSRVALAKKNFWPDVGVGVDWVETGAAIAGNPSDSGKDPVVLMFSMNIPLWRDKYSAAQRQAEANVRKVSQKKTEMENNLLARTDRVFYEFEDTRRKIDLYSSALVPKAKQLLLASETAYQSGTVDFLSLIDAQRTLLQFELEKERVLVDHQKKLAQLEMLVGTELSLASDQATQK